MIQYKKKSDKIFKFKSFNAKKNMFQISQFDKRIIVKVLFLFKKEKHFFLFGAWLKLINHIDIPMVKRS